MFSHEYKYAASISADSTRSSAHSRQARESFRPDKHTNVHKAGICRGGRQNELFQPIFLFFFLLFFSRDIKKFHLKWRTRIGCASLAPTHLTNAHEAYSDSPRSRINEPAESTSLSRLRANSLRRFVGISNTVQQQHYKLRCYTYAPRETGSTIGFVETFAIVRLDQVQTTEGKKPPRTSEIHVIHKRYQLCCSYN